MKKLMVLLLACLPLVAFAEMMHFLTAQWYEKVISARHSY